MEPSTAEPWNSTVDPGLAPSGTSIETQADVVGSDAYGAMESWADAEIRHHNMKMRHNMNVSHQFC